MKIEGVGPESAGAVGSGRAGVVGNVVSATVQQITGAEKEQDDAKQKEEKEGVTVQISEQLKEMYQKQLEAAKENAKAAGEGFDEMAKALEIARRIAKGDRVPPLDEKKLMEFSSELYQMAKAAAAIHANEKHKNHKSLYEDEESDSEQKIRELRREGGASTSSSAQESAAAAETAAPAGEAPDSAQE